MLLSLGKRKGGLITCGNTLIFYRAWARSSQKGCNRLGGSLAWARLPEKQKPAYHGVTEARRNRHLCANRECFLRALALWLCASVVKTLLCSIGSLGTTVRPNPFAWARSPQNGSNGPAGPIAWARSPQKTRVAAGCSFAWHCLPRFSPSRLCDVRTGVIITPEGRNPAQGCNRKPLETKGYFVSTTQRTPSNPLKRLSLLRCMGSFAQNQSTDSPQSHRGRRESFRVRGAQTKSPLVLCVLCGSVVPDLLSRSVGLRGAAGATVLPNPFAWG